MRHLLSLLGLLVALGCSDQPTKVSTVDPQDDAASVEQTGYTVLTEPPNDVLDRMASEYPTDIEQFRQRWAEDAAASPIDGQQAIKLLEIACYADVECHRVEYPLRIATLDYIQGNAHLKDVESSLRWISTSYESRLPLDAPGDEAGQFRGMLVHAMRFRMREYADELLASKMETQNGK